MSQHWIYINSPTYRRFVAASTERRSLLYAATALLGGASLVAGYLTMNATNPNVAEEGYKRKDAELAKLPMHSQVVARTNREQLRAMMLDVVSGNDSDRYKDMLDGKIHGTRHGTSMPDSPPPPAAAAAAAKK